MRLPSISFSSRTGYYTPHPHSQSSRADPARIRNSPQFPCHHTSHDHRAPGFPHPYIPAACLLSQICPLIKTTSADRIRRILLRIQPFLLRLITKQIHPKRPVLQLLPDRNNKRILNLWFIFNTHLFFLIPPAPGALAPTNSPSTSPSSSHQRQGPSPRTRVPQTTVRRVLGKYQPAQMFGRDYGG